MGDNSNHMNDESISKESGILTSIESLSQKGNSLLNKGKYSELEALLANEYNDFVLHESHVNLPHLMEIAGLYIDLGEESRNKTCVEIGLQIIQDKRSLLKELFNECSIEYNIANAYHALHKIATPLNQSWFITPEQAKGDLFSAKQSYLKAFKLIDLNSIDNLSTKVLTNLSNNLNWSCRIVESLQYLDIVLKQNPDFPEALISKAETLNFMIRRTHGGISISLVVEIYNLYKKALLQNPTLPIDIEQSVHYGIGACEKFLTENNFDLGRVGDELELNQQEFEAHSKELKFYLNNFLSLSEHSLYCNCDGAKAEDLMIGYVGFNVTDNKIVELEHLLNRIKSEFSFARRQLYEFKTSKTEDIIFYQDFGVHEIIYGVQSEKIRISFRMCFGILDKIAQGILYLFDLKKSNNENVYFESFWRNPKAPNGRWENFNEVQNIHLTALYSIACDLSNHNGEFNFYKQWRNQLEHDVFSLIPKDSNEQEVLGADLFSKTITIEEFEDKVFHLLQLVRASIFSFAYCCREELVKQD